jgi:predicted SnoaL-like aldol condensation-catalyzing enzyme
MLAEEENKRLALSVIEALNARNLSQWSHYLSETYAAEYPGVPLLNKTQCIAYNKRFVIAFPDTHFEVKSVAAQGDQVFIHWTVSGTQAEQLATLTGRTIPSPSEGLQCGGICSAWCGRGRSCVKGGTGISPRSWISWA